MNDILSLRVKKVIPETREAITLILSSADGLPIIYQAGQFLTFIFDINGKEVRRSYSLSSAPGIDLDLAVTIKRVQNGEISRFLFETVKEGTVLKSLSPTGRFTVKPDNSSRDIFLFGAGSGIVPLFSILKAILTKEPQSKIHLIYSNHDESTIIFRQQIEKLRELHKNRFDYLNVLSDPKFVTKDTVHAHLNSILLEQLIKKNLFYGKEQSVFYICGPFAYMRMIAIELPLLGFSRAQINREAFLPEINESHPPIPTDNIDSEVKIRVRDKEYSINVPAGTTILRAALEKKIQIPYSCESGICSTCSAHCTKGEIGMSVNEVLTEKDLAEGLILTCTGYPVTDRVEIRF
jgi:ring-1,2-phenylacetyl-CoA epoxidase subunit PaaE